MFKGCTSLTTAPSILPATTLAMNCYTGMFQSCINLTTAPELPAITFTSNSYTDMFRDCESLSYIKCLTVPDGNITTQNWVSNVATTGIFIKNASAEWATGVNGIPEGWTVQNAS